MSHADDCARKDVYRERARTILAPLEGQVQSWAPVHETDEGAFVECQVWIPKATPAMQQAGLSEGCNAFASCGCGRSFAAASWPELMSVMAAHERQEHPSKGQSGLAIELPQRGPDTVRRGTTGA